MANHETKEYADAVDLFMAFQRTKDGEKAKCIRVVIKDEAVDLAALETRLERLGGHWRIHKTVNKRDTEKARIWLLHKLIDNPEVRGFVDSMWRTALLQSHCVYGEKRFLLDIDTKKPEQLAEIDEIISASGGIVHNRVETTNGWHIVTNAFDTRKLDGLCDLIRDGYIFVKKVSFTSPADKEIMTCKCGLILTYNNILHVEGNAPWFQCPKCHEEYVAG